MKEAYERNAKTALAITTALTLFVAGYEVLTAMLHYQNGMNFFDIASFATVDMDIYCLVLILANIIMLPWAVLLFRQSGISMKKEIAERKTLGRDILLGLAALSATLILSLGYAFLYSAGKTELGNFDTNATPGTTIIKIISLVFVSGIIKEIYFRSFAKHFVGKVLGETPALLLFNLMFAMLDWYNIGFSFFAGLIWIWAYKKSGHLISSIIAHGGANLAGFIFLIITNGVV